MFFGAACLALVLAACGQEQPAAQQSAQQPADSPSANSSPEHSHDHMHGGSTTTLAPAYDASGELRMGTFQPLPDAPGAASDISGHVWTAENADGTRTTVEAMGLRPGSAYMGHLHAQPCARDAGGPHFAFDPDGPEAPPNEVHLMLTADQQGMGMATVENSRQVGAKAQSAVLHVPGGDARMVCADLSPITPEQARAASSMADDSDDSGSAIGSMDMSNAVTIDVQISNGAVEPSGERLEATVGQPIRLRVNSDAADELHVHSDPEHTFDVQAKDGQTFAFTIDRPGVYEVESHETGNIIVSLAVTPR